MVEARKLVVWIVADIFRSTPSAAESARSLSALRRRLSLRSSRSSRSTVSTAAGRSEDQPRISVVCQRVVDNIESLSAFPGAFDVQSASHRAPKVIPTPTHSIPSHIDHTIPGV